ncbi:MAG: hypothetical protein Ct9H300mP21_10270 [Pseudomonadota bacterium]|nr:MAG: hypothetical protein Ct9H300mP21_10270 [Pseudomonadota bacterium]
MNLETVNTYEGTHDYMRLFLEGHKPESNILLKYLIKTNSRKLF